MSLVDVKNQKNGVTYVYESVGYWDKEKQQARNHRKCIGKRDPSTGEIIPSKKITISEFASIKKSRPITFVECKRNFYGATYLFDAIGKKFGITADLKRCFPDLYKQILSIAYYLIMEDRNPMSRFSKWALTHSHPYARDISSQRSSELFGSISENDKQNFFKLQGKRRAENEFIAYDTTSISSYSKSLKQVKYGFNKENDPLPQINMMLLFGEKSRIPFYYRKLPGNIPDVKTLQNLLSEICFSSMDKVKLVMDRGFYSELNINTLYRKHYKFIIAAKVSLKFISKKLDEIRGTLATRPHYSSKYGLYYDSFTTEWDYSEVKKREGRVVTDKKRLYLHIYYNEQRATDDKNTFNKLLDGLETELLSGNHKQEHEKNYVKYYDVKKTPVKGVSLIPNQEALDDAVKNCGYFALISNGVKEPLEALEIYRAKDVIEKAFGNLKERLNMRRTSVSSEENLEGKLFVQFIALIYLSYIKKAMTDNDLFKNYTMQELLDELDIIERFDQSGRKHRISEMTQKQINLYKCLGVDAPT